MSLNSIYSTRAMRRRYEVWFLRFALADGSDAWWFRYLLMNLGRSGGGCAGHPLGAPAQIWATWFPRGGAPQTFLQGFTPGHLSMSERFAGPFRLEFAGNRIDDNGCRGSLVSDGHRISWDLRYRSTAAFSMSDKGWIGFSRTPHSDAVFSGRVSFDDLTWEAAPLGFGLQGHNCGYRHRSLWTWCHAAIQTPGGKDLSSFEALEYAMPLGLHFRRAILWHAGRAYDFRRIRVLERTRDPFRWTIHCSRREDAATVVAILDGTGPSLHRVPYLKTNCSGAFPVFNNSLAAAKLYFKRPGQPPLEFRTDGGAVLEMSSG